MIQLVDTCVSCDLPCAGKSCPNHRKWIDICDKCHDAPAEYHVDGQSLCSDCLKQDIE